MTRLVVLISGGGSNLQTLLDGCHNGDIPAEVVAVISNKADAFGLKRAQQAGIATEVIDHRQFADREHFDAALAERIDHHQPDLIALAGFMRILTAGFVARYQGRMLNIHPSLLPKYPGLHTHQRAIDAGDTDAGATVHFVTAELDGGPPIAQASVPIKENDTASELAKRVLAQEHRLYPSVVRWFAEGRLTLVNNQAILDGTPLPKTGRLLDTANHEAT
ncbi:phosphoribosylglycinamide formyltransferase [Saccharospirillum sp. MSK14-1]|uniref:phosphoribosylglycinamide formyltransferase n=1 Tax=Saccharospirillum sp. MSK14-1 TaxID=1897632 RepID=UPI000D34A499|nr:phosphoribosylglycinamide formyltransferase [Saccharospirillum sp. MSK14-1]PTY36828.1 phosphoribosylglycinamide formyltransferase [Saccharospirillum sp. MSK14-1]